MTDRAARDERHLRRGSCTAVRVGAWLTAAGLVLACGGKSAPPPGPKPFRGPGIGPVTQDSVDPLERPRPAEPGPLLPPQTDVVTANAAEPQHDDKPLEARDYPAELLQRLGNPASCLAQRPNDGKLGPLQIGISAQLMPSGALARTELQGQELSGAERACLAQRVGAVRLQAPIDGAPFAIQASLTLQPTAAKVDPDKLAKAEAAAAAAAERRAEPPPIQAEEGPTFVAPSPEAKEVPPAPPVQPSAEDTTP